MHIGLLVVSLLFDCGARLLFYAPVVRTLPVYAIVKLISSGRYAAILALCAILFYVYLYGHLIASFLAYATVYGLIRTFGPLLQMKSILVVSAVVIFSIIWWTVLGLHTGVYWPGNWCVIQIFVNILLGLILIKNARLSTG